MAPRETIVRRESHAVVGEPGAGAATLASRSFHALKWNYAGNAARAAAQLLIGIVLARLLGPEAFGVVAVSWLLVGIGTLISDLGFGAALVQRAELTPRDVGFVFTVQVGLGAALSVAGAAVGGIAAAFFHRPDAAPVIRAMSLLFLLQSFGQTPLAVLRRSLDFRGVQTIGIISYAVGYVGVGIPLAYAGAGAWSLVAAQLLQSATSSALALRRSGVAIRPVLTTPDAGLVSFGSKVVAANAANWAISNADSFIVGRVLGVVDLGLYSRSLNLLSSPTSAVTSGLQGVLFAACARAQADRRRVARAFVAATTAVATLCLPVFLAVAAVPSAVIEAIYGPRWTAATPVLVPIALAMPVAAVLALVGPVLTAVNRVGIEVRMQALALVVLVPVVYGASHYSLVAVGWGLFAVSLLRCALLVRALLPLIEVSASDVLRVFAWPALCGIATAAAAWTVDRAVGASAPWARLVADAGAAGLTLLAFVRVFARRLLHGPYGDFLLSEGRLPVRVRQWLGV